MLAQRQGLGKRHSGDQRLFTHRINQTNNANTIRKSTPEAILFQLEDPIRVGERSAGDAQRQGLERRHSGEQRLFTHRINQTISANTIRRSTPEAQVLIPHAPCGQPKAYH
jgi:hypothetical protein